MTQQIINDGQTTRLLPILSDARRQSALGVSRRARGQDDPIETGGGVDDFIEISTDERKRVDFSNLDNQSAGNRFNRRAGVRDPSPDPGLAAGIYRAVGIQAQQSFIGDNLDLVG